jgi:hypothetical protein
MHERPRLTRQSRLELRPQTVALAYDGEIDSGMGLRPPHGDLIAMQIFLSASDVVPDPRATTLGIAGLRFRIGPVPVDLMRRNGRLWSRKRAPFQ